MFFKVLFFLFFSCEQVVEGGLGILMSGGDSMPDASVEVYVPSTNQSCSLPSIPDVRVGHSMDNLTVCGGEMTKTSCMMFSSGMWLTSYTLTEERSYHLSWQTTHGSHLIGGDYSPYTTELVPSAGQQGGPSFTLKYKTRNACAMPDLTSDSVIITGGINTKQVVSRYDRQGYLQDLPHLIEGRFLHACGSYLRYDGNQIMLVAGGWDGTKFLSSTEVLTTDSDTWTMSTPLPVAATGFKGVTVENSFYISGGWDSFSDSDDILKWEDAEQAWEKVGKMKIARSYHAVAIIQMEDEVMKFCE